MEAEDRVSSEVHSFSKEESLNCHLDTDGGKSASSSNEKTPKKTMKGSFKNEKPLEGQEEKEHFTCLLGSNGQVVLWNPEFETVLSRFEFSYPHDMVEKVPSEPLDPILDQDGDLKILRKHELNQKEGVILIEQRYSCTHRSEHQRATTLDLVGEQVWRGALFLADFLFHNSHIFENAKILELASGVGLTSVVAAMLANQVIITDIDKGDIHELICRNVNRNSELLNAVTHIKEIDFYDLRTVADLGCLKDDLNIILVADVIYHNQLTDAFMETVLCLMKEKPNKVMYIALEKRYVFTIEDMDTVAPCYEYFVAKLEWLKLQETSRISWSLEEMSPDFPQYFTYERTRHLVLWKIEATLK